MKVAALYVETGGVYFDLPDVDPWDAARDARLYEGPWPVVAHPPCQKWCQLAPLNASRIAGYEVGDDGGTFAAALSAVREYGGVLEHPALSLAWREYGLPVPTTHGWTRSMFDPGWTTEVAQVAYGHAARKRTWLYYVGESLPPALDWREPPATAQVSAFGLTRGRSRWTYAEALDKGKSNPTPKSFRDVLLDLARIATAPSAPPTSPQTARPGRARRQGSTSPPRTEPT